MTRMRPCSLVIFISAAFLHGAGLAAQMPSTQPGDTHAAHAGSHNALTAAASEAAVEYFTVNVSVTDTAIEPSAIFVPAGRPVQLLLRNRGTTEHHYRVVGLAPDDLAWVVKDSRAAAGDAGNDEHDHHNRTLVRTRSASPAGIVPSGREVHAYVSEAPGMDVVLFTATQTGTFLVQCDLHPEATGRLTVFDPAPAAPVRASGNQPFGFALNRDLGTINYAGAERVHVEAMYMPARDPAREPYVEVLLTERIHTANLPGGAGPPELFVSGNRLPPVDEKIVADSPHHRATSYRYGRDATFGTGHQVMTLRLVSGQEATWHLPVVPAGVDASGLAAGGAGQRWGLILALLGGMVAAMWPCLFQLTVYFIPALAGVAMQDTGASKRARRRQVLQAALFFILGFTLLYTATGAVIGFAAQRLGDTGQFEVWQRYFGVGAGVIVIGLALRVAAKVRAPLVCRMPVLSAMADSKKPASRVEMMLAGVAFATGCMTCFGSALVVGMVVYIGLAQSAFYGALVLFLFSLGMGVPLVLAAAAMAQALPLLMKLETAVPWMGLFSAILMAGFGTLLISGNYMVVAEWSQRLASGSASLPIPLF